MSQPMLMMLPVYTNEMANNNPKSLKELVLFCLAERLQATYFKLSLFNSQMFPLGHTVYK